MVCLPVVILALNGSTIVRKTHSQWSVISISRFFYGQCHTLKHAVSPVEIKINHDMDDGLINRLNFGLCDIFHYQVWAWFGMEFPGTSRVAALTQVFTRFFLRTVTPRQRVINVWANPYSALHRTARLPKTTEVECHLMFNLSSTGVAKKATVDVLTYAWPNFL